MAAEARGRRLLVFGARGQVGHELIRALGQLGEVTSPDRAGADLGVPESLRAVVRACRPHVIVNAAAYTAVDRAESEPTLAWTINGAAPAVLAEEAEALDAILVHYSTDYVFDGRKASDYDEGDAPSPLSVYGRSKLAGERAVTAGCRRHLVFRTSWVVGAHGANFLKSMLRLAAERDTLRVVADQHGAPTSAALIADVTARVLQVMDAAPADDSRWGLYHLAAAGETTWYGYATYVVGRARELGMPLRADENAITAITTADYPTAASRPANSRLCTSKLQSAFGVELPDWRPGVNQVLEQLRSPQPR